MVDSSCAVTTTVMVLLPTFRLIAWEAEPLDTVEVSSELIRGKENVFALKVKGTSMIDALINDGDIVLMQQANTAENGEMVAAWLKKDGETTLKKLYKECL